MKTHFLSIITATTVLLFFQSVNSIAKPNNKKPINSPNVTSMGDGVKFTLQRCTQISNQEKVVCEGNFRSSNGERSFTLFRDDTSAPTKINDSSGKTYIANEIQIGGDYNCKKGVDGSCSGIDVTLVEGVDYKAIFTFTNVSLSSSKIPLFSIGYFYSQQLYYMKYRNISVKSNQ
jgi:hypothetical protein